MHILEFLDRKGIKKKCLGHWNPNINDICPANTRTWIGRDFFVHRHAWRVFLLLLSITFISQTRVFLSAEYLQNSLENRFDNIYVNIYD